jgi:hypothetical protein
MVDLLVLTSSDQLLLIPKETLFFFTKQASLMAKSTVLSFPPLLVFSALGRKAIRMVHFSNSCQDLKFDFEIDQI